MTKTQRKWLTGAVYLALLISFLELIGILKGAVMICAVVVGAVSLTVIVCHALVTVISFTGIFVETGDLNPKLAHERALQAWKDLYRVFLGKSI